MYDWFLESELLVDEVGDVGVEFVSDPGGDRRDLRPLPVPIPFACPFALSAEVVRLFPFPF